MLTTFLFQQYGINCNEIINISQSEYLLTDNLNNYKLLIKSQNSKKELDYFSELLDELKSADILTWIVVENANGQKVIDLSIEQKNYKAVLVKQPKNIKFESSKISIAKLKNLSTVLFKFFEASDSIYIKSNINIANKNNQKDLQQQLEDIENFFKLRGSRLVMENYLFVEINKHLWGLLRSNLLAIENANYHTNNVIQVSYPDLLNCRIDKKENIFLNLKPDFSKVSVTANTAQIIVDLLLNHSAYSLAEIKNSILNKNFAFLHNVDFKFECYIDLALYTRLREAIKTGDYNCHKLLSIMTKRNLLDWGNPLI